MALEDLRLLITKHAHEQYGNRVEPISKPALLRACRQQIAERDSYREAEYLHLGGVWWIAEYYGPYVILITCYGRSSFYLPAALRWQRVHKDRVVLG